MSLTMPSRGSALILDSRGHPVRSSALHASRPKSQFSASSVSYGGMGALPTSTRFRDYGTFGHTPRTDDDLLPWTDRLFWIALLRNWQRTNPTVASILLAYTNGVGSPTPKGNARSAALNDKAEKLLLARFKKLGHRRGESFAQLTRLAIGERLVTGGPFHIRTARGKIQQIPAELCGSLYHQITDPSSGLHWSQGILHQSGVPVAYRFGVRHYSTGGSSRISYDPSEGAKDYAAQHVHYVGDPTRIEELRYSLPFLPAVETIQDQHEVNRNKVTQVKNQTALTMFITKTVDPELQGQLIAYANEIRKAEPETASSILDNVYGSLIARSPSAEIQPMSTMVGEVGEDAKMISPSFQSNDFDQFDTKLGRKICGVLGIPLEEVMAGYSNSNYSSSRADRLRWANTIAMERSIHMPWMDDTAQWLLRRESLFGNFDWDFERDGEFPLTWQWPVLPEIDQVKQSQKNIANYAAGLTTKAQIAAETGQGYFEDINEQNVQEAADLARRIKKATLPQFAETPLPEIPITAEELRANLPTTGDPAALVAALGQAIPPEELTPPPTPQHDL